MCITAITRSKNSSVIFCIHAAFNNLKKKKKKMYMYVRLLAAMLFMLWPSWPFVW